MTDKTPPPIGRVVRMHKEDGGVFYLRISKHHPDGTFEGVRDPDQEAMAEEYERGKRSN